jgi:hypothetical protein
MPIRLLPYFVSHDLPSGTEFDRQKQQQLDEFKDYLNTLPEHQPIRAQYPQYATGTTDLCIRVSRDIGAIQSDIRISSIIKRVLEAAETTIQDQTKEQMHSEMVIDRRKEYIDSYTD